MNPMNMIGKMMGGGGNPMQMLGGMQGGAQGGFNPMQMLSQLQSGKGNPMQMLEGMLGNNPQYRRVMQMVQGKSPAEMRQVAQNLCEQRGIDFNEALGQIKQMGIDVDMPEK